MKCIRTLLTAAFALVTTISFAQDTIRFGVSSYNPPYVFNAASGYADGLDIQVAQGICKELGTTCTFIQVPNNKGFALLNEGKIDAMIGAIQIIPSKKLLFNFSKPYIKTSGSFLTGGANNLSTDPTALEKRRMGVVKDSAYYTYVYQNYPGVQLVTFDTAQQLVSALLNKKVDVIVLDTIAANYWMGYNQGQLKKIGKDIALPGSEGLGIVVKKGNQQLLERINKSIDALNSDNRLYNRIRRFLITQGKI